MSKPDTKFAPWLDLLPFLLIGAILRLWNFGEMPFTNDELSALHRTHFSDFGSLIREGVAPDAHPALTQVFLWLWVKVFDTSAWLIRLPFVAAGIGSMAIIYRLAAKAFGRNTAQMAAALMAGSQILIYFSDVARPYAFGMLICSALAWYWYRCVYDEKPGIWPHLWLALLLALSVYNHYFSGLLGIIIWLTGMAFAGRIHLKYYLGSGVLAFVFFLPHLSVSLTQLGHKGVGSWLRPPAPDFLWEWFMSLINYSPVMLVLLVALLAWKAWAYVQGRIQKGTSQALVFLAWFAVSYAIGHAYSLMVDPLLHHGALLFATPFFCLGLAFFLAPHTTILAKAAPYIVVLILTYSLAWQRNHFEVFEHQPYAKVAGEIHAMDKEGVPALAIVNQNPAYLARYIEVDALHNTRVINLAHQSKSNAELMKEIGDSAIERLYLDGRNWSICRGAQEIRSLDQLSNGFTYTGHHFNDALKVGKNHFKTIALLQSQNSFYHSDEFLEVYKVGLDSSGFGFGDHVAAVFRFDQADSTIKTWPDIDLHLVFSFSKNGEPLHYSSAIPLRDGFTWLGSRRLVHQLLLWDLFINYREMKNVELKVYLWNPKGLNLPIESWEVNRIPGNPNLYSQLNRRP